MMPSARLADRYTGQCDRPLHGRVANGKLKQVSVDFEAMVGDGATEKILVVRRRRRLEYSLPAFGRPPERDISGRSADRNGSFRQRPLKDTEHGVDGAIEERQRPSPSSAGSPEFHVCFQE
jgi:hypothetical protein